jgi:hypothetical protein
MIFIASPLCFSINAGFTFGQPRGAVERHSAVAFGFLKSLISETQRKIIPKTAGIKKIPYICVFYVLFKT